VKQAKILVAEINRKRDAIRKTESTYLINDYHKSIRSDLIELRDYCKFKGLDFSEVVGLIK
jgi:hypothetical protein